MPDATTNPEALVVPPISLRRRATDHIMTGMSVLTVILVLAPLFAIFAYLVFKGIGSINLAFLTQTPKPVGEAGGGMANAIVGTGLILAIASLLGVPLGIGAGIFLSEYGRNRYGDAVRLSDVMDRMSSIVIGIVAYGLVVIRQKHFSALAGGVALAIMMVPTDRSHHGTDAAAGAASVPRGRLRARRFALAHNAFHHAADGDFWSDHGRDAGVRPHGASLIVVYSFRKPVLELKP